MIQHSFVKAFSKAQHRSSMFLALRRLVLKNNHTLERQSLKCMVTSAHLSCPYTGQRHSVWGTERWICTDVTFRTRGQNFLRQPK